MKRAVFCSLSHKAFRPVHWAILLLPNFLSGCFDSQNEKPQQVRGKGITSLGRFFSQGQNAPAQTEAEAVSESMLFLRRGISVPPDLAQDVAELKIALPGVFHSNRSAGQSALPTFTVGGKSYAAGRGWDASNGNAAGLSILNSSFSQLFSSIFNKNKSNDSSVAAKEEEDLPNPFTDARVKKEAAAAASPEVKPENKEEASAKTPAKKEEDTTSPPSTDSGPITEGAGIPLFNQFLLIGDFDHSGRLSILPANRRGDTVFVSEDGERDINLSINVDAVGQKRAFYIDDIDGNGTVDLLVTSISSLLGAVMLGDGNGGYRLSGTFPTKYEPVIPMAGPIRNGRAEILAVNTRTGAMDTFLSSERYSLIQTASLPFLPDYLLRLVTPDTSREFVRAAQTGGTEQILSWGDDSLVRPISETLGADALILSSPFKSSTLQIYQVGSYASLLLANQGSSFNVANLRVRPQTFLLLGDFLGTGSLDVAVGALSSYTPKK
jgi:hypothetical protein